MVSEATLAAAEAHFGVAVVRGAAGEQLFCSNAWTPFEYDHNGNRDLFITGFRVERCSTYNTLVRYVLFQSFGRAAFRFLPKRYPGNPCAQRRACAVP